MKNLAYLLLCVAACIDNTAIEDGIDDPFLIDGKTDTGGIYENSPQGLAVLRVVNEKTWTEMKDHGVPPQAASAIDAVRRGDDNASTADDVVFTSLAQLDAVPYVGPNTFSRLLAYATDLGYVGDLPAPVIPPIDPWHVSSCEQMTFAQLALMFPSGSSAVELHRPYTTAGQHRVSCDVVGCTPWEEGANVEGDFGSGVIRSMTRGTTAMRRDTRYIYVGFSSYSPSRYSPDFNFGCLVYEDANSPTTCSVHESASGLPVGFTSDWRNTLRLPGRICADGSYHFASNVPENGDNYPGPNLNQVALYGRLF